VSSASDLRAGSSGLPDLSRTAAAIEAFDVVDAEFEAYMSGESGDPEIERTKDLFRRMEEAGAAVGLAYGEDTRDRNSPETCEGVVRPGPAVPGPGRELSFVRRMVAQWREQERES